MMLMNVCVSLVLIWAVRMVPPAQILQEVIAVHVLQTIMAFTVLKFMMTAPQHQMRHCVAMEHALISSEVLLISPIIVASVTRVGPQQDTIQHVLWM